MLFRRKTPKRIEIEVRLPAADFAALRYDSLRRELGHDHSDTLNALLDVARALAATPGRFDDAVQTYLNLVNYLSATRSRFAEMLMDPADPQPRRTDLLYEIADLLSRTDPAVLSASSLRFVRMYRERRSLFHDEHAVHSVMKLASVGTGPSVAPPKSTAPPKPAAQPAKARRKKPKRKKGQR